MVCHLGPIDGRHKRKKKGIVYLARITVDVIIYGIDLQRIQRSAALR